MTGVRTWQIVALGAALGVVATLVILTPARVKKAKPLTTGQLARLDRSTADDAYNTPKAEKLYGEYVDRWKNSPDKQVQDQVGAARIRLGYVATKTKNWEKARSIFKTAAAEYKGTGSLGGDFGGIPDQALYQAAVCLNAEGKKAEYRKALVDFIKTQPLSPLVDATYKRLVKVDGKSTAEDDALIQGAHNAQQKKIRFETSVCGPKVITYLLKAEGKGDFDYKAIAKECGTTDRGTSLEALRRCLRGHGLPYFGFQVAKEDLAKIELPAILAVDDHYFVVTKASPKGLTVFDPGFDRERQFPLDKITDPQFSATLLLKSAPPVEAN